MAEIERKYLVNEIPNLDDIECNDILQGYISINPEVRIRSKNDKYYLTKKSDDDLSREEIEVEISKDIFDILRSTIKGNMISKKRYKIPLDNNLIAELDIYNDYLSDLLTVEVEFSSIESSIDFIPPIWFGKEITYDKQYKNKSLSQMDSKPNNDIKALVKKDV